MRLYVRLCPTIIVFLDHLFLSKLACSCLSMRLSLRRSFLDIYGALSEWFHKIGASQSTQSEHYLTEKVLSTMFFKESAWLDLKQIPSICSRLVNRFLHIAFITEFSSFPEPLRFKKRSWGWLTWLLFPVCVDIQWTMTSLINK